jgi:predicted transcriptional regulator
MPHILSEMLEQIDTMAGNATSGALIDLRAAVVAADAANNSQTTGRIHDKLNEVSTWLADDSTSNAGATETVETFTEQLNSML